MLENETHVRMIGYGGMLMESFVAIMALAAAASLDPGVYFAMNSPAALIGTDANTAAEVITTKLNFLSMPQPCCTPLRKWAKTPSCPAQAVRLPSQSVWRTL